MKRIILFDGECNFCDQSVQFILKRDKKEMFMFASLQGKTAESLLDEHGIDCDTDSFVYIEGNHAYIKSSAALRVSRHLTRPWKWLSVLLIIPTFIRDFFYDFFAKNRYKWFGKKESCMLPSPDVRKRFLD